MRKIKCSIFYPWSGIESDKEIVEIPDDIEDDELEEFANGILNDMIWDRVSADWEVIE